MNPIPVLPAKPRRRRVRSSVQASTTPVLILATYDPKVSVTLGFDREIDVSALDGSQITITDGALTSSIYVATGTVTVLNPTTVRIRLNDTAHYEGTGIVMNATGSTGIVAVGGGAWGGCGDLALPYAP